MHVFQQRLAVIADDIPTTNKRSKLDNVTRETSEERTDYDADRHSSDRDNCLVPNGDCEPGEKWELGKDSERKVNDLISESLMNGKIKDENLESRDDADSSVLIKSEVKDKVKEEEMTVKEEKIDEEEFYVKTKQKHNRPEDISGKLSENVEPHSCNGYVKEEEIKKEDSFHSENETKASSPLPPKELLPIYDPYPYLPRLEDFELVVTSVEQLRALIQKFGDLPEGPGGDEEKGNPKKPKVSFIFSSYSIKEDWLLRLASHAIFIFD